MERLTQRMVDAATSKHGSQQAGWYALAVKGYTPAEIAIYTPSGMWEADVRTRIKQHAEKNGKPLPVSCAPRRTYERAPLPTDWKQAFQSRVMRTGMVLHLSQPMLEFLCAVADGVRWDRATYFQYLAGSAPDNSIATGASLAKRGLIIRKDTKASDEGSWWELTPAGHAVVELLKVAGVFIAADAAIQKQGR